MAHSQPDYCGAGYLDDRLRDRRASVSPWGSNLRTKTDDPTALTGLTCRLKDVGLRISPDIITYMGYLMFSGNTAWMLGVPPLMENTLIQRAKAFIFLGAMSEQRRIGFA